MRESHVYFGKPWRRFVLALRCCLSRSGKRSLGENGGNLNMEDKPSLEPQQTSAHTHDSSIDSKMEFILESLEGNDYRVACSE